MKKNKQLSVPQMVILLDVLFIFLFILIIKESPPTTEIVLPDKQLERGGFLSHEYEKGKYLWYDPSFQRWSGAENSDYELHEAVGKYILHVDCNSTCINKLKENYDLGLYDKNISVVITNELYDKIARITYLACQTDKKNCGDITFPINNQWDIDKSELLDQNLFLKRIPGMLENL